MTKEIRDAISEVVIMASADIELCDGDVKLEKAKSRLEKLIDAECDRRAAEAKEKK